MKIPIILFFSAFLAISPTESWAQEIVFKNRGKQVRVLTLGEIEKIVPATTVRVFEPHESAIREYKGFQSNSLFTAIYGQEWEKAEEILFTCSDGYQPSIPSERFKKYEGYLAYSRPGTKEFVLHNKLQNNELVKLGPLYLVWDNIKSPELRDDGGYGWPYQITAVDLINFSDRFPKMAPPGDSPSEVKNGFLSFRAYCMSCHTINGEGGGKSVELNYPVNVTEYIQEPWLLKWIDNPASMRYNTTMPALNPNLKDREKIIKNIVAYLKTMKDNKGKPASE